MQRRIVLVSGPPASGKTSIAIPLASRLGFPLLSKDDIKESMWDALQPPASDMEWSRRLGGAAMEVLWALATRCPGAVLDAPFRPKSERERSKILTLNATVTEVHCSCGDEEAKRRYVARRRHPAHVLQSLKDDYLQECDGPVGIGDVIEVDTCVRVDLEALARRVLDSLSTQNGHPGKA